ncbi:MAG TPA: hypothetical protein VKB88_19580, partial [Bryobacteraceae bacterium]|nr:hypothetical protein [Bryobacteraceae bacterium]
MDARCGMEPYEADISEHYTMRITGAAKGRGVIQSAKLRSHSNASDCLKKTRTFTPCFLTMSAPGPTPLL